MSRRIQRIIRELEEQRELRKDTLLGGVPNFNEYLRVLGAVQGLSLAISALQEALATEESDND